MIAQNIGRYGFMLSLLLACGCSESPDGESANVETDPPSTPVAADPESVEQDRLRRFKEALKDPESSTYFVEPPESMADIDMSQFQEVVKRLNQPATRSDAIDEVTRNADQHIPPALYAVASAMFSEGQQDESLFWYYLGQLRARSDANKCNDVSARQAVSVLNMRFGAPINKHAFGDLENLRSVVSRVVEWDRTHEREYDPRWISLHGMGAFTGDAEPFTPESEWAAIDIKTRQEYLEGFEEVLTQFAEIDSDGDGKISDSERAAYVEANRAKVQERLSKLRKERDRDLEQPERSEAETDSEPGGPQ